MKNILKSTKKLIVIIAVVSIIVNTLSIEVKAIIPDGWYISYDLNKVPKKVTIHVGLTEESKGFTIMSKSKATSLKSSNKDVAAIDQYKISNNSYSIDVGCKKSGKAKISFKIKNKLYKIEVTVLKYKKPITSVTIGNKIIPGTKFNKKDEYSLSYNSYKGKNIRFNVNLKKGWFVDDVLFNDFQGGDFKRLKNGGTIKLKSDKKLAELGFYIKNKKTGQIGYLTIFFK